MPIRLLRFEAYYFQVFPRYFHAEVFNEILGANETKVFECESYTSSGLLHILAVFDENEIDFLIFKANLFAINQLLINVQC